MATWIVFAACGFVLHDLPLSLIAGRPLISTTVAFSLFALATIAFAKTRLDGRSAKWSAPVALAINLLLLAAGLAAGVGADHLVSKRLPG